MALFAFLATFWKGLVELIKAGKIPTVIGLTVLVFAGTVAWGANKHNAAVEEIKENSTGIEALAKSQKGLTDSQNQLTTSVKVMAESVRNMSQSVTELKTSVQHAQEASTRTQQELVRIYRDQVNILREQNRGS